MFTFGGMVGPRHSEKVSETAVPVAYIITGQVNP